MSTKLGAYHIEENVDFPMYYRISENDVYNLIIPQLGSRGVWFDILMFLHSPSLHTDFFENFPQNVYDISGGRCFLDPEAGVGMEQWQYRCRTKEGFIRNFNQFAKPALEKYGLPYFDKFKTADDLKCNFPDMRVLSR